MIMEAAKEGGALEFIQGLNKDIETLLDLLLKVFALNLYRNKTHPLCEEMEKLDKKIDISGGERQRIAVLSDFLGFSFF